MRRREVIKFLGGAAVARPPTVRERDPGRAYRLGGLSATRLETPRNTAFLDEVDAAARAALGLILSGLNGVATVPTSANTMRYL
jgi:hypothetical protein